MSGEVGIKHDEGKLRYDLIPPEVLELLAEVFTYGAEKYKPNSWQNIEDFKPRYTAAAFRHIQAWRMGQRNDEESGLPHLAHAATNILFLLSNDIRKPSFEYILNKVGCKFAGLHDQKIDPFIVINEVGRLTKAAGIE